MFQKIQLFTGSILENIGTGIEGITEEDIIESAKLSCAHDFIVKMPGGYNYQLIDAGGNLSGGQRQAIALARALVRKPSILVLDEPTSSMDGATEERIINNIKDIANKNNLKIITTEKDYLRLTKKQQKGINFLKVKLKIQNINKLKKFLTSNI